jgi:hypothetical protein
MGAIGLFKPDEGLPTFFIASAKLESQPSATYAERDSSSVRRDRSSATVGSTDRGWGRRRAASGERRTRRDERRADAAGRRDPHPRRASAARAVYAAMKYTPRMDAQRFPPGRRATGHDPDLAARAARPGGGERPAEPACPTRSRPLQAGLGLSAERARERGLPEASRREARRRAPGSRAAGSSCVCGRARRGARCGWWVRSSAGRRRDRARRRALGSRARVPRGGAARGAVAEAAGA